MIKRKKSLTAAAAVAVLLLAASSAAVASAQSGATRPRRVAPSQPVPTPTPTPTATTTTRRAGASTAPARATPTAAAPTPATSAQSSSATAGTARAFSLYQQKQYDAALQEARQIASADPKNSEAWKIAGFVEMATKKYDEAATDLERALELQRAAKEEDPNTLDALAQAYLFTNKFDRALPLLVAITTRAGAAPDAQMLYYRGLAEFNTQKTADAERSFNAAVKANPKSAASLYYLGRIAFDRKDYTSAVNMLNRSTLSDPKLAQGWTLLAHSYLRRAQAAPAGPKADADYLAAVRAGESLRKVRDDEDAALLHGQALIYAKQYAPAAAVLERAAAGDAAQGTTLYLLGFAHARAKNFPKAVAALERAAQKTPDNADVYRELGFAYESSKLYAKALGAYEKGLQLAPADEYFKESAERVRPFAK